MNKEELNFDRLNYLLSLNLSKGNIAKRMYRSKKDHSLEVDQVKRLAKRNEYLVLSIVKSIASIEED